MPLWCFVKTKKVFFVFSKLVFFFWVSSSPSFFFSFLPCFWREKEVKREREREFLRACLRNIESGVFIGFSLRGKKVWWASSTSASALTVKKKKKKVVEAGS